MSVKQSRYITPTFQMVLNKQIGDAMDCINEGNLEKAFEILQTMIDALKEKDSEPLLKNDVAHIKTLLEKGRKPKSVGFYRGLIEASANQEAVLRKNIRLLFRKIMRILHRDTNYLEWKPRKVPTSIEPGVGLQK